MVNTLLTSCLVCNKEIATLADKCPNCGAPNEWVHSGIKSFMAEMPQCTRPYTVKHNKTEIQGTTERKFPWWMWFVILFCSIPGFAMGFIPGLIIAPIAYYILLLIYGKKLEFYADLQNKTWKSNNDKFWRPVKQKLEQ